MQMLTKKKILIEKIEQSSTLSNCQTLKNKLLIIYKENQQQQQQKQNLNNSGNNSINNNNSNNNNNNNNSSSNISSSSNNSQLKLSINQSQIIINNNNHLNQDQLKSIYKLINLLQSPEKLLRSDPKIRFNFISSPTVEHDLFVPLRLNIDQLNNEINQLEEKESPTAINIIIDGIDLCGFIKLVIRDAFKFIQDLVIQVKLYNGNELALDLLEEKPIIYTESHSIRSISLEKAFTLASYDPKEYYFIRKNQSGNSIGSIHDGVYYKVDSGNTCLKPARENAICIFYNNLFNDDSFISPSNLFFIDQIPMLPPDSGECKEREELMKKKNELKLDSSQEVLKRFPELEKKILNLSIKRRISIQASLLVDGITLEQFLLQVLNDGNGSYSNLIYSIDMESYSAHIISSLLLIPTDYKCDNIIIENGTNKIIGIDNDLAMESDEIEKDKNGKVYIRTKNILYLLPQLNEQIHPFIREKFIKHNPQIFILNWLLQLLKSEKEYSNLVNSVLSYYPSGEKEKAELNLNGSLMFPLCFLPNWIPEMLDRFIEIKQLLVNNPSLTHQELLRVIHPYSSLYFEALSKHYQDPFVKLLSIYNREFDFIRLLNKYPPDIDEADLHQIYNNVSQSARMPLDPSVPIISCIKGLLLKTNITHFSDKDLLELVEIVFKVEQYHKIQNDQFHRSWYTSTIFPSIIRCGASFELIEKFKKHFRFYGNDADISIIHAAIESKSPKLPQLILLLSKWFDLEHSINGYTPLDLACATNNIELFSFLISLGAGVKASYVHVDNFYKQLTMDQKISLKDTMTRLYHINPKSTWKISLNHLLPMQTSTNFIIKTASEGTRTIANRDLWNSLFYQNGSCTPKKSNKYGSRAVPFIEDSTLNHRLYCKFWPQFPGLELSVTRLGDLLFGYIAPYSELASINEIPVLISQAVIGEPLNDVLLKYPERINQLCPSSISKMILMAILINPSDGNLGNYIISPIPIKKNEKQLYKIISLDNDQAFMPARCKELKSGLSLQVETVLFLFDQMKQPIHQEVYSSIKNRDLNTILKKWVQNLKIYQQNTMDLFSRSCHEKLKEERKTVLSITFARGMIKKLYSKLIRLQIELNKSKDKPITHLQLLEILEPIVATRYKNILNESSHLSIYDRFKKLKRLSSFNNDADIRLTSSLYTTSHLLESREIPNIKDIENDLWSGNFGPLQVEAEIDEIRSDHLTFQNIFNNLDQNTSFLKVLDNSNFTDIFIENLLKQLDFNNITVDQEKTLFKIVQDKEIRYLTLKNSKILNSSIFFKSFNFQSIVKIHFINCQSMESFKKSNNFLDQTKIELPSLHSLRIEKASSFYANILAPNLKDVSIIQCSKFKFPIEVRQNQSYPLIESLELEELNLRHSLSSFPTANINIERLSQCYPNLVKLDISFAKFKNLEINFQHENLKILIAKEVDLYKITFDGESKLEVLDVRGSSLLGGIGIKHQSFFKSLKVLKKDSQVNLDSSYIGTNYPGIMAIGGGVLSSYFIKELTSKISILGYTSHVDSFSFKGDFFGLFDIGITKITKENETFDRFPLIANRSSTLLFIIDTSNSLLTDLENIFIHCNKYYREKIEEMLFLGGIKPVLLVLCDDKEYDVNTNNLKDLELLDRIDIFKLNFKIHEPTIIYHINKNQLDESLVSMESIEKDIINDDFKSQLFNLVKDNHKLIMSNKYQGVLTVSFSLGKISDTVQYVNLQKSLYTNELLLNVCNKYNINSKEFIFTYSNPSISQKRIELNDNITIEQLMSILGGSIKQIYLERNPYHQIKLNNNSLLNINKINNNNQ